MRDGFRYAFCKNARNPGRNQGPGRLRARPVPPPHPLETGPPLSELTNPTPAATRDAARYLTAHLEPDRVDDFVYGLSEAVTNAVQHGRPPVRVRLWAGRGHAAAAITDHGPGPTGRYAGLLPDQDPTRGQGGLGLWTILQLNSHVSFGHDEAGFTLRLATG